ncbi:MAG: DUF1987 domain-containing protein [Bacteroidales bacterium]|nr:DUF1987 domain-containing protein [Bacteroidales bacterium]
MQKFYAASTLTTPEICFSPEENIFLIRGTSAPEDVRAIYYPVIEWISLFIDEVIQGKINHYSPELPLKFQTDLNYFNSSSAKFIYDIFLKLKQLKSAGVPVIIEWFYEEEDIDLREAGADIAMLVNMEFTFIPKSK